MPQKAKASSNELHVSIPYRFIFHFIGCNWIILVVLLTPTKQSNAISPQSAFGRDDIGRRFLKCLRTSYPCTFTDQTYFQRLPQFRGALWWCFPQGHSFFFEQIMRTNYWKPAWFPHTCASYTRISAILIHFHPFQIPMLMEGSLTWFVCRLSTDHVAQFSANLDHWIE